MRHKKRIISKVKSRYWKTTHKCGIRLPHSVEEALELDRKSNTDHWAKAVAKENKRVKVSWHAMDGVTPDDVRDGKVKELTGYQEIKCHMIFDVKMDFTRKARFVARGDLTTSSRIRAPKCPNHPASALGVSLSLFHQWHRQYQA